ncbi:hypothetical protein ABPG74_017703 [Tetrahymena malaccensis]
MGTNNSKQRLKDRRDLSQQSVSTELDNSSSSYYSNYEELRIVKESNCLSCQFKKGQKPNWLRFFHSKCDKMILSNIPWAYDGKLISELKGKRDYRGEYDEVFNANLKKIKQIMSERPIAIVVQEEPEVNMNNLLGDLDTTQNPNQNQNNFAFQNQKNAHLHNQQEQNQIRSSELSNKRSEKQFSSSHFTNDNEFQSVKSDLLSNPTPINNIGDGQKKSHRHDDQSNYQSCNSNTNNINQNKLNKEDPANISGYIPTNYNHNVHNNSFPSYMLENQFQGLRAGHGSMVKDIDPDTQKKNLQFYFECTSRISQHLDDHNFTLFQIRQLFITSFYSRYSQQIKQYREQLETQKKKQEETLNSNQNRTVSSEIPKNQFQQQTEENQAPQVVPLDQLQHGQESNYLYNNISSYRFSSEEKYSPMIDAFKIYKNAIREFQYFVKIYMEVIKQYYDIHYKKNIYMNDDLKQLFSYHNFQNFVISKVFQNEKIPKILIELIKLVIPDDRELISSIDRTRLTPQMFGIPPHLSLDEETRRFFGSQGFISSDGFGSIKEELEEQNEKSISTISKPQLKLQGQKISDQNAINSDKYSKSSSFTDTIDSNFQSKQNSHQMVFVSPQIQPSQPQTKEKGKKQEDDEDEFDIENNDEEQDIIFELKVNNKSKMQVMQYYQQNDPLRGNSTIFNSDQVQGVQNQGVEAEQQQQQKVNPYQKCIDYIHQMKNSTTPTGKFKSIILACESIQKCITEYYKQNGRTFNTTLDEQSIISILTYAIAQTGFCNLDAHCKFVQSFYKNPSKKIKLKYYLIAFEVSVRNVQELYYSLYQQEKSTDSTNVSDRSPQMIFKKNIDKRLSETFGSGPQSNMLKNITGKNSFLKQTLQGVRQQ